MKGKEIMFWFQFMNILKVCKCSKFSTCFGTDLKKMFKFGRESAVGWTVQPKLQTSFDLITGWFMNNNGWKINI